MRVLFVEDSELLQRSVGVALHKAGYAVDVAVDGEDGLFQALNKPYDVIILDLMLPKLDGHTLLRRLREAGRDVHVLILSAKDAVEDRVHGLMSGSDDYLVKPFALDELLARVAALARRGHGVKAPVIKVEDLLIDTARRKVTSRGREVELPPREYAILEFLAMRRGHIVSRTEIESHVYDDAAEMMSNVVDAAIYSLRRRLDPPGGPSVIRTRRGAGYMLGASGS
jgi:DNA-binding response OmpR family regulator